jgi:hypothetical protein
MLSLRDLQKQFAGVLFEELPESEVPWVRSTEEGGQLRGPRRAGAAARLAIYRNNLREGFIKALALEFPVIQRLVGDDYFRQLAQELLSAYPSRTGDLHAIGAPFSEYLRTRFAETEYAYFADVAALEWAYQQSAIAAEASAFDVQSLARVPPESYGALRFNLHPACFLIQSAYPILRIWQVNQAEEGDPDIVDLSAGPDYVVTRRLGVSVELRRVSPVEYVLLQRFFAGETLAEALAVVEEHDPAFDLGRALRQFIALGLVTHFHTENLFANEGVPP